MFENITNKDIRRKGAIGTNGQSDLTDVVNAINVEVCESCGGTLTTVS